MDLPSRAMGILVAHNSSQPIWEFPKIGGPLRGPLRDLEGFHKGFRLLGIWEFPKTGGP